MVDTPGNPKHTHVIPQEGIATLNKSTIKALAHMDLCRGQGMMQQFASECAQHAGEAGLDLVDHTDTGTSAQ